MQMLIKLTGLLDRVKILTLTYLKSSVLWKSKILAEVNVTLSSVRRTHILSCLASLYICITLT